MFIFVAIIFGTGWAFLYPSLVIYAVESSGSARGPAMGTFTALADLGAGIGPMIMGIILEWTSYPIMFLVLAFIGVINFLYFRYTIRKKGGNVGPQSPSSLSSPHR
jgi:MFS family permease